VKRTRYAGNLAEWGRYEFSVRISSHQNDGRLIDIKMTPANEAAILDLAYVVMEKYRGGLGTTLAVLDETAKAIRQLGSDAPRTASNPEGQRLRPPPVALT
jgi:hypothetical protein